MVHPVEAAAKMCVKSTYNKREQVTIHALQTTPIGCGHYRDSAYQSADVCVAESFSPNNTPNGQIQPVTGRLEDASRLVHCKVDCRTERPLRRAKQLKST
ncbi:unnamed protein product [Protopolystoma xenopodis]|uniref:Uncharacterized protein n=1 Tax=Protopolystoma xenopodis TaxID=117903 RepID=A0A448XLG3_9PLAT|nr:unnamed protein product [Protopolystoma xenopodis]